MSTKYHQTEGFKFPAAGLIGLDAGTKASVSKFLRARERELNTIETVVITCDGGPFNGQSIELQPNGGMGEARSAEFTVGAWRGHYMGSSWVSTLEADAPAPQAIAAQLPQPKINIDLPAKGFDQLRNLIGEMSINPLERETTIKTRYKTARFEYGKTDDFGNEILEFSPVGAYACELVQFVTPARGKKTKPAIVYKIKSSTAQHGAMAIDDFGDLFITIPRSNEYEDITEKRQFTTYKIGRTTYTIPATIEAAERLAAKILKLKKWHTDKMLRLAGPARAAASTQQTEQMQPESITMAAPVKIEQPAKLLEPVAKTPDIDLIAAQEQMANPEFFYKSKRRLIDAYHGEGRDRDTLPALLCKVQAIINDKSNVYSGFAARLMENFKDWMDYREYKKAGELLRLPAKIEQPAKPLTPQPATTCNPDALRLRSKAAMCRAANRPTWAEKLEAQADALERLDPPEPPPGNKATPANSKPKPQKCKHATLHKIKAQRPHKTACIRLARIRHPAKQKYGQPFRQNFNEDMAERPISNGHEPPAIKLTTPPGIKTITPSGNFYNPNRAKTHATPTI